MFGERHPNTNSTTRKEMDLDAHCISAGIGLDEKMLLTMGMERSTVINNQTCALRTANWSKLHNSNSETPAHI